MRDTVYMSSVSPHSLDNLLERQNKIPFKGPFIFYKVGGEGLVGLGGGGSPKKKAI